MRFLERPFVWFETWRGHRLYPIYLAIHCVVYLGMFVALVAGAGTIIRYIL